MKPAAQAFKSSLAKVQLSHAEKPIVWNVLGKPQANVNVQELLAQQITSPVKWSQSLDFCTQQGITKYVEIGPGKVLSGLIKQHQPTATCT